MPIGAAIGGVGALASAGASIYGANRAADAQTSAANQANSTIRDQYASNSANLAPWISGGKGAFDTVSMLTGTNTGGNPLTAPLTTPRSGEFNFSPTQAQLEQTPGYQFTLGQGLKSVQNSYASKGLASSGAAMKGAADYAGGLASNTYQQQFQNAQSTYQQNFQNYWQQNRSIYDMLTGQSTQGLNAAGALAGQGMQAATQMGNNTIGAGNAQGAAANATGSAMGAGINGATMYGILGNYLSNGTSNNANPAFGGNGVWGGSSQNPLEGLSPSDYGMGY